MNWFSKKLLILVVLAVLAMSPSRSDTSHEAAGSFKTERFSQSRFHDPFYNSSDELRPYLYACKRIVNIRHQFEATGLDPDADHSDDKDNDVDDDPIVQSVSPSLSEPFNSPTGSSEPPTSSRGFSVELIPWNSPESPYHNPNATRADLSRLAILSSNIRSEYRKRRDEAMDRNAQAGLYSLDNGLNIMPPFGMNSIYGDYIIRYNIGSNPTYGIFDTGSDLIWLQSSQCDQETRQLEPLSSPTYRNIRCGDTECSDRMISIANCLHDQTCHYRLLYADQSFSEVNLAPSDIFTFAPQSDASEDLEERRIVFGCGGSGHGSPGVVGSSRNGFSLLGQMGFDRVSYCASSLGHHRPHGLLKLGSGAVITGPDTQTPLYSTESGHYYVKVVGIKVWGVRLRIDESVFHPNEKGTQGVIIDTGTPFTELVSEAYDAVVAQMKRVMLMYGEEPVQDDNYELCCEDCFRTPLITIIFEGLEFPIPIRNMWDVISSTKYCLAFRRARGNLSVIGMFQQRDVNVGIDFKENIVSLVDMDCSSIR